MHDGGHRFITVLRILHCREAEVVQGKKGVQKILGKNQRTSLWKTVFY